MVKTLHQYEAIRFFKDDEVAEAIAQIQQHPMFKAMLHYSFENEDDAYIDALLQQCHSIADFQQKIIRKTVEKIIDSTSDGVTDSGFEQLDKNQTYLFLSNHRDILLDSSILNLVLMQKGMTPTANAIGDNLLGKQFQLILSKLNRNFIVKRSASPREILHNSIVLSGYIRDLLQHQAQSVWMAQREGRTKDGNDRTQQGVLKMLSMARGTHDILSYFDALKIVPLSISYEFDPTDILKVPEVMAKALEQDYKKTENEDFNSMLRGALGNKKRIHIAVEAPIVFSKAVKNPKAPPNDLLQEIARIIDQKIHQNYKLWPFNYLATDLLNDNKAYADFYSEKEKQLFMRRIQRRVDQDNALAMKSFLEMYARPVINTASYERL
ncbi:MAG: 1-acyl-sn-glycerol-3-phosphate acyltransferase [Flavobacteriaceae bacterium]|nr:1-acyl-sn-glycerol-3-phosphate acyltransferase [Flavobacteriaceae bacterium]